MALAQQEIKISFTNIVKLTICFYENPAAKQEITFWEGLVKQKIKTKSKVNDIWSYHLNDEEGDELVVCIPIELTEEFRDISNVSKLADGEFDRHKVHGKLKYGKTLIFGKVETEQLKFIAIMMDLMSRGKWR